MHRWGSDSRSSFVWRIAQGGFAAAKNCRNTFVSSFETLVINSRPAKKPEWAQVLVHCKSSQIPHARSPRREVADIQLDAPEEKVAIRQTQASNERWCWRTTRPSTCCQRAKPRALQPRGECFYCTSSDSNCEDVFAGEYGTIQKRDPGSYSRAGCGWPCRVKP